MKKTYNKGIIKEIRADSLGTKKSIIREMSNYQTNKEALEILLSGMKVARQIIEKRLELDRQGKSEEPLHIFMGEHHRMPSHYLHNMVVANELLKYQMKPLVCLEHPHDTLEAMIPDFTKTTPLDNLAITDKDINGSLALHADMAFRQENSAPLSSFNFKAFLAENRLPVSYADASRDKGMVNNQDFTTLQSIEALGYSPDTKIDTKISEGVHIRNHHLMQRALQAAENNGSRIILYKVGNKHVRDPSGEINNAHTLPAVATDNFDAEFLAFTREEGFTPGLKQNFSQQAGSYRISGLPKTQAHYDSWGNLPLPGERKGIVSLEQEDSFLGDIFDDPNWSDTGLKKLIGTREFFSRKIKLQSALKENFSKYLDSESPQPEQPANQSAPTLAPL